MCAELHFCTLSSGWWEGGLEMGSSCFPLLRLWKENELEEVDMIETIPMEQPMVSGQG